MTGTDQHPTAEAPTATPATWADVSDALGLTWKRWPASWLRGRDYSAGWTATVHLPGRAYVYVDVQLWRRLLDITWQVDARRMEYSGRGRSGRALHTLAARAYLEDPTPLEALAAASTLGLNPEAIAAPAARYAALAAQAEHAGFVLREIPNYPGQAAVYRDDEDSQLITVSIDDDADDAEARRALDDLARILAEDSRAAAAPDTAATNVGN